MQNSSVHPPLSSIPSQALRAVAPRLFIVTFTLCFTNACAEPEDLSSSPEDIEERADSTGTCVTDGSFVLLADFGDRRLYQYDTVVTDLTFALGAVDTPTQRQYVEFLEEVNGAWPDVDLFDQSQLLVRQRDLFVNAGVDDGSRWNQVLDGSVGEVTAVSCLQSIFFDQQNRDFPLWQAKTEAVAAVLTRNVEDHQEVRAYLITQDGIQFSAAREHLDRALADHEQGWEFLAHFHSHYFAPDGEFDVVGTVAPSKVDLNTYRRWQELYDLSEAWITNGIHSMRLTADEFSAL